MARQRSLWFTIILFVLTSLACNAFAGAGEPTLPPPPVTTDVTPAPGTPGTPGSEGNGTGIAPTATLPGGATADPAATLTPGSGEPMVTILVDLNIRSGPGVVYDRVGLFTRGETARVIGRAPSVDWWQVECPARVNAPECWVSGGAQYTRAENVSGVPVVNPPPTPTSAVPTVGSAILVFGSENRLWVASLNMNQNPPTAGEPYQLADNVAIQKVVISPDGRRIAYVTGAPTENELRVVNVDGTDSRTLARSRDLPVSAPGSVAIFIDQVQWLADNQTIAFNTGVTNLVGPGAGSQEDLWTVTLNSQPQQRFSASNGGGAFAVSPNNQVVMSLANRITRANLDGTNSETLINYNIINTASEYIYYPRPQWTANGSQAYVAVPSREQFDREADATLWRIPTSGPAQRIGNVRGNILFNPVLWTADGSRLAYVQQIIDPSNPPPTLIVADSSGENPVTYSQQELLQLYEWNPDNRHFLYSSSGTLAVGQVGESPVNIPLTGGQAVWDAQWLNTTAFVAAAGSGNTWNLISGNLAGATAALATTSGTGVTFDVWAP